MKGLGVVKGAFVIATLCCFGSPQADAIDFVGGPSPVAQMDDGMIYRTGAHRSRVKRVRSHPAPHHRLPHRHPA